jgi:hypothetical protein
MWVISAYRLMDRTVLTATFIRPDDDGSKLLGYSGRATVPVAMDVVEGGIDDLAHLGECILDMAYDSESHRQNG